jgi:RNA polymerase sigma-70 factor (ECF subfamily)
VARTPDKIHDEWLVLAAQSGEVEAFQTLMRRHLPAMARHARRLTGDSDAAAEITQDACLAIVRGLGRLDDPATFEPWVLRIVANKAADWIRRRRRQREVERSVAPEVVEECGVRFDNGLSAQPAETIRLVRQALKALPRGLQVVVGLYYAEGRSVAEAAGVLGVPLGTVKSRLHSARRRLKAIIRGNDHEQTRRRH